jgi:hypothetical protein
MSQDIVMDPNGKPELGQPGWSGVKQVLPLLVGSPECSISRHIAKHIPRSWPAMCFNFTDNAHFYISAPIITHELILLLCITTRCYPRNLPYICMRTARRYFFNCAEFVVHF